MFLSGGYSGSTNVRIDCRCGSRDPACINIAIPYNDIQRTKEKKTCLPVIRSQPVANKNCTYIYYLVCI